MTHRTPSRLAFYSLDTYWLPRQGPHRDRDASFHPTPDEDGQFAVKESSQAFGRDSEETIQDCLMMGTRAQDVRKHACRGLSQISGKGLRFQA